jgi:quinol monooxygenase YgiN
LRRTGEFVAKIADEPGTLRYESFREPDGVS